MSRGGAEHAEKIVGKEHCNWSSAVTAAPRDQVSNALTFSELRGGNSNCLGWTAILSSLRDSGSRAGLRSAKKHGRPAVSLERSGQRVATERTGKDVKPISGELIVEQRERDRLPKLLADDSIDSPVRGGEAACQCVRQVATRALRLEIDRHVRRWRRRAARRRGDEAVATFDRLGAVGNHRQRSGIQSHE